jgi:hypothetical protein
MMDALLHNITFKVDRLLKRLEEGITEVQIEVNPQEPV